MKIGEREFKIYQGERPKVLLLGNGLCRAFDGMSWDSLLDEIKDKRKYPSDARYYVMPMPLKAAMLTNNNLAKEMRKIVQIKDLENDPGKISWSSFTKTTPEMQEFIRRFVETGFDYVLTTNYSYEIEAALIGETELTPTQVLKMMNFHEVEHAQTQFLINTFNLVDTIPVWHIHGEARKPESMIIGSFFYGKLLRRCIERLDGRVESTKNKQPGDFPKRLI